ncbi:hypothetical protein [Enterococcus sp. AZ163]|uniref:hypothetical protein n=1 Tax=Enterococcus sp. AZ163 TaxID=2774638 RepID=UPI003D2CC09D
MIKHLKNNFMQAAFGSTVWIAFLTLFFTNQPTVPVSFIWRLLAIGSLFGLVFGVVYPYLWEYSIFKARTTILLSTLFNTLCGFAVVYLYSVELFSQIRSFFFPVLLLTLIGHLIGFYFYSNYTNRKLAAALNSTKENQ